MGETKERRYGPIITTRSSVNNKVVAIRLDLGMNTIDARINGDVIFDGSINEFKRNIEKSENKDNYLIIYNEVLDLGEKCQDIMSSREVNKDVV